MESNPPTTVHGSEASAQAQPNSSPAKTLIFPLLGGDLSAAGFNQSGASRFVSVALIHNCGGHRPPLQERRTLCLTHYYHSSS